MPNHVMNIITAPAHVLDAIRGGVDDSGDPVHVDFNRMIPMPKELHVTAELGAVNVARLLSGEFSIDSVKDTDDPSAILSRMERSSALNMLDNNFLEQYKDESKFQNLIQILRNCRDHGYPTWYEWSIRHWGTKWNAYSTARRSVTRVEFQTAWSAPHPVIAELAAQFPTERIVHEWADEDTGSNCGMYVYEGGVVAEDIEPDDAIDFALSVWGDEDREYYRQNPETGKWEFYEGEEDA